MSAIEDRHALNVRGASEQLLEQLHTLVEEDLAHNDQEHARLAHRYATLLVNGLIKDDIDELAKLLDEIASAL